MWIRLLVDAKHQWSTLEGDNLNMILKWCQEGLNDPHVRGGDKLTLEKKFATFSTKKKIIDETKSVICLKNCSSDSDSDFEPPSKRRKGFKSHAKEVKSNAFRRKRKQSERKRY